MNLEECTIIKNYEGFLVDSCTGEVITDEYRFSYERYDNLIPVNVKKVDSSDEEKYLQYMKLRDWKNQELDNIIKLLFLRIGDEKIREEFLSIVENAKKYGKAGVLAAFAIAHYLNGISVRTKKLREEFAVGMFEYRQIRKILQLKIKKSVNDIDKLVLNNLEEEELKKKYMELKEKGVFSGKSVSSRIKILLGERPSVTKSPPKKNNEKVMEVIDDKGHVLCPKCGMIGFIIMREKKGHIYYYIQHYVKYSYKEHYLGKNIRLQKRIYFSENSLGNLIYS
ncbi:Transcription initiation factor IIB [Saccharolobus shibatae B12]|uniref:Transcription initiation factor IIB n=1 Tax=Saccharolobus shibatae (strain ATCC 51178 / DSM 5389 / JCM 8931 / NBRC 15437 / B12) TaxID=523848 RepID=A0A8F5BR90_SACSH|nr:hypothetical protein [Saccharolobus shibatae]QXJ27128.1 Transcription initiation factor IIB [Saccharolobus shibatae B12]QXJ30021.1 Transcription initiation factor IIB [Saccharolobus shibatae B12]